MNGHFGPATQPAPRHRCFSGTLACSGCWPCEQCKNVILRSVLSPAFASLQNAIFGEVDAAMRAGRPMNMQGILEAHFAAVMIAWRDLHQAMLREPDHQAPFQIADVSAILQAAEAYRAMMMQREVPQPPPAPPAPFPVPSVVTAPATGAPTNGAVQLVPPKPPTVDYERAMAGAQIPPVIDVAGEPAAGSPQPAAPPKTALHADDVANAVKTSP